MSDTVEVLSSGSNRLAPTNRRRWPALLAWLGGVLALALITGTAVGGWVVQRSFPTVAGDMTLSGLSSTATVQRDSFGIPVVAARTTADLFFTQGFVHAQDRFWEMDVRRHITAGRLAEMFGAEQVETDAFVRTLGWRRVAEQELELLSPRVQSAFEAYAAGVNAYLDGRGNSEISVEYVLLGLTNRGYEIEPWQPADSLAWLKAMAWDLRSNLEEESERTAMFRFLRLQADSLFPEYPYDRHAPIVTESTQAPQGSERERGAASSAQPAGTNESPASYATQVAARSLDRWLGKYGASVGSNSWAVTGSRSESGGALLANDPHLAPSLPGVWYQMSLQCRPASSRCPYDVSGFTFAGVPGVIIGHNDRIAWGFTNLGADVSDLFYEAIDGDNYLRDGKMIPLEVRSETISVAGGNPITIEVRATENGPLISDVSDQERDLVDGEPRVGALPRGATERALSLRWTALDPGPTAGAILALNEANDFADFRKAAKQFVVPSQNMLYADVDGHIGYQAPGRIPIRGNGEGLQPTDGWIGSNGWKGFIPFKDLPTIFDPPTDYIVTANNAVVDQSYPYFLGKDWAYGFRSQRIVELIESSGPLTVDDMTSMQDDAYHGATPEIVGLLLESELSDEQAQSQDLLRSWDMQQDAESAAAAYYNACWRHLLALTFHDNLPRDYWPEGGERWTELGLQLAEDPSSVWWDDVRTAQIVESKRQILLQMHERATAELVAELGRDQAMWRWGDLHTLELVSPTFGSSGIQPLEMLFNRGPVPTGGSEAVLNATGWSADEGYEVDWLPSMRMVVNLQDFDASRWIQFAGQSGHVFHPNYWDQTQTWRTGDTLPWSFSEVAVDSGVTNILVLSPG